MNSLISGTRILVPTKSSLSELKTALNMGSTLHNTDIRKRHPDYNSVCTNLRITVNKKKHKTKNVPAQLKKTVSWENRKPTAWESIFAR